MSKNRKRTARGRRCQRRTQLCVVALTLLCAAGIGAMAIVNRLPIGDRYTYTAESDLWFVEGGEVAIAAPQAPTLSPEPSPTPTPAPEIEYKFTAERDSI